MRKQQVSKSQPGCNGQHDLQIICNELLTPGSMELYLNYITPFLRRTLQYVSDQGSPLTTQYLTAYYISSLNVLPSIYLNLLDTPSSIPHYASEKCQLSFLIPSKRCHFLPIYMKLSCCPYVLTCYYKYFLYNHICVYLSHLLMFE